MTFKTISELKKEVIEWNQARDKCSQNETMADQYLKQIIENNTKIFQLEQIVLLIDKLLKEDIRLKDGFLELSKPNKKGENMVYSMTSAKYLYDFLDIRLKQAITGVVDEKEVRQ